VTSPGPSWPSFLSLCDCFWDAAVIGSIWWPRQILSNDSTNRASVVTSGRLFHKWSNRHLRSLSRYPSLFSLCSISSHRPQLRICEPPSTIPLPACCRHPSNAHRTANIFSQYSSGQQGRGADEHLFWAPKHSEREHTACRDAHVDCLY